MLSGLLYRLKDNWGISLVFIYFFILTLFGLPVPFFWDGPFFTEAAVHIYQSGLRNFIVPLDTDTGSFPLFSTYLAFVWKIFGKTLVTSHVAMFPFVAGIAWEYYKLARRFIRGKYLHFAMLLLIADPVLTTQALTMGYDIMLLYFFLLSLNALLSGKRSLYAFALSLLILHSIRGMFGFLSLFILNIALTWHKEGKKNPAAPYLPAVALLISWLVFHKYHTGWFLLSPEEDNRGGHFLNINQMMRQLIYIAWYLADLGRFPLWLFAGAMAVYLHLTGNLRTDTTGKKLYRLLFIPLGVFTLLMAPISNPIGHRYFLIPFLLLNIITCYSIQKLNRPWFGHALLGFFLVSLITGNLWLYPERFSNSWDGALKVIPCLSAFEEMKSHIREKNIDPVTVGTGFPFFHNEKYTRLREEDYHFIFIGDHPTGHFRYILHSNAVNYRSHDELKKIEANWELVKETRSWKVYFRLYKNPNELRGYSTQYPMLAPGPSLNE